MRLCMLAITLIATAGAVTTRLTSKKFGTQDAEYQDNGSNRDWSDTDGILANNEGKESTVWIDWWATSGFLLSWDFEFDVPETALIKGIELEMERRVTNCVGCQIRDREIYILQVGDTSALSINFADTGSNYGTGYRTLRYGGSNNLLGMSLDRTAVMRESFGLAFRAKGNSGAAGGTLHIDYFTLKLFIEMTTTVASLSPTRLAGCPGGSEACVVTVTGQGFYNSGSSLKCKFGSAEVSGTFINSQNIKCQAPPDVNTYGTFIAVEVTVTNNDWTTDGRQFDVRYGPPTTIIAAATPNRVGQGSVASITFSAISSPTLSGNLRVGLTASASCDGISNWITLSAPFPEQTVDVTVSNAAGLYFMCAIDDANLPVFQTSGLAFIEVVDPADVISSVYPSIIGVGVAYDLLCYGSELLVSSASKLALAVEDCNTRIKTVTITRGNGAAFPAFTDGEVGVYKLCLSYGGAWVLQTTVEITSVARAPTTYVAPMVANTFITAGLPGDIALLGATATHTGTFVAMSPTSGCTLTGAQIFPIPFAQYVFTINVNPAVSTTYHVCVSVDDGGTYSLTPGTLDVFVASATDVIGITPSTFWQSSTAALDFAVASSLRLTVGMRVRLTTASPASPSEDKEACDIATPLGTQLPGTLEVGTYRLCLTANDGKEWFIQTLFTLNSYADATQDSLSMFSPSAVGAGPSFEATVTGAAPSPSARVALAFPGRCSEPVTWFAHTTAAPTYTMSVPLPATVTAPSVELVVCYSVDGGVTYVQQKSTPRVTVAVASPVALSDASPLRVLVSTPSTVSFTGAVHTPGLLHTTVGIASPGGCDSPISSSALNPDASFSIAVTGTYAVCYSTNGGADFVEQLLVVLEVTDDLASNVVSTFSPKTIGLGTTPSVSVTVSQSYASALVGLARVGECDRNVFGVLPPFDGAATTAALGSPSLPAGGLFEVCHSSDGGTTWTAQIATPIVQVISAFATSITQVTPNLIGLGLTADPSFTFSGAKESLTSMIAFTLGTDCSAREVEVALTSPTVLPLTVEDFTSAGLWKVCYTVDAGDTWVLQTLVTLSVQSATDTAFTSISESVLGVGLLSNMKLTHGPGIAFPTARVGFSLDLCGTVPVSFAYTEDAPIAVTFTTAGNYQLCYSVNNGASWTAQTLPAAFLTVIDALSDSIASILPNEIGADFNALLTFEDAVASRGSAIAFVVVSTECNLETKRLATSALTAGTTANIVIPDNFLSSRTFYLCYTVNGADWTLQVPELTVRSAELNSVLSLSYDAVGVGTSPSLSLPSWPGFLGGKLAFVFATQTCESGRKSEVVYDAGTSFTLSPPLDTPNAYSLCASNNGVDWVKQPASLDAVGAVDTSVFSVDPVFFGVAATPIVTFHGARASPSSAMAFVLLGGDCDGERLYETPLTASDSAVVSIAAGGTYELCYTVDGSTYVKQRVEATRITVLTISNMSVVSIEPAVAGLGTAITVTVEGAQASPTTWVSFVPTDRLCSEGAERVGTMLLDVAASGAFTPAMVGEFSVCYSVSGAGDAEWVKQVAPGVSLSVVQANADDVGLIAPSLVGLNALTSFVLVPTTRRRAASRSLLALYSGVGARVGFVINPETCESGTVLQQADLTTELSFTAILTVESVHTLCWSVNGGATWATQGVSVQVLAATPTAVQSISPHIAQQGVASSFAAIGVPALDTITIAFAFQGGCLDSTKRFSSTRLPPVDYTTGTRALAGLPAPPRADNFPFSVCYSVNHGATFVEQTLPTANLTVIDCTVALSCSSCQKLTHCTFCLAEASCLLSTETCASDPPENVILAAETCPTTRSPTQQAGSSAGGTEIVIASDYFAEPQAPRAYQCSFFSGGVASFTNATWISSTELRCPSTPARNGAETARLSVTYAEVEYADTLLLFLYYYCDVADTCDTCSARNRPECGTCLPTGVCGADFECSPTATGVGWTQACPEINSLSPTSAPLGASVDITITGTLFVPSQLSCRFVTRGEAYRANVTQYVSPSSVVCPLPAQITEGGSVQVSLVRWTGASYTDGAALFSLQLPAGLEAEAEAEAPINAGTISAIVVILFLVCMLSIVLVAFFARRNKIRQKKLPPKLSPAMEESIIYGKTKTKPEHAKLAAKLATFEELVFNPSRFIVEAVADCTAATEMEKVAKAVQIVAHSRGESVALMTDFVTREVRKAESQTTCFRTNSFATKLFKTYSKQCGLKYLHDLLALPLYQQLSKYESLDIKGDQGGKETIRDTFHLLEVCQVLFIAIVKSEKKVPYEFRQLFTHVVKCMKEKWPIDIDDLAQVVVTNIQTNILSTGASFQTSERSFDGIQGLEERVTADPDTLAAVIFPMQENLGSFRENLATLSGDVNQMLRMFDRLEGALDPSSQRARDIIEEHSRAQNSIAVGGFFFLRFLVPAITAPEAYQLVRMPPTSAQRQILVLIGKVLQNLSNNKRFGSKETSMEKLNEFIAVNQEVTYNLFASLASVPAHLQQSEAPHTVPRKQHDAAIVLLYEHVSTCLPSILENLNDCDGLSDQETVQRKQIAKMFVKIMEDASKTIDEDQHDTEKFASMTNFNSVMLDEIKVAKVEDGELSPRFEKVSPLPSPRSDHDDSEDPLM